MPKCVTCGDDFDVDDARIEFDTYHEWAGEVTYDEQIEDLSACADCAIAYTQQNLDAGRDLLGGLDEDEDEDED